MRLQVLTYAYTGSMQSRSEDTKSRLLSAARDEFAAHGIAGTRTGRIAMAAGVNEALLFRYFGSKQALFEQVYTSLVRETVEEVPLDPANLGAYAGDLFDYYGEHAHVLRLSVWAALEAPDAATPEGLVAATREKEAAIAAAQKAGVVSNLMPAGEMLALVIQLSLAGASVSPALGPVVDAARRRNSVVTAVTLLTAPTDCS